MKSGWVPLPYCRPLEVPFLCLAASQTVFLLVPFCNWPPVCFVSSNDKPNPYQVFGDGPALFTCCVKEAVGRETTLTRQAS